MQAKLPRLAARILAGAAIAVLLVSACSSNAKTSSGSGSTPSTTSSATSSAAGAAMLKTTNAALGTFLTDGNGRTLYMFMADTTTQSTCNGACATFWPPVLTSGTASGAGGIDAAKLGTTKRNDGTMQVTYNGHPLYTFSLDKAPGDTNGQGLNQQGGLWWVVGTDGNKITTTSGSSGSSSPAGGGGVGGY